MVEGVEEPVLERELAGARRIGGDVRVDGRLRPLRDQARPPLVAAARVERVPGEVEVVLVPADEILRGRTDLDEIEPVPGAAQRDRRLAEQRAYVDRLVRFAGAALVVLRDQPDDGCVALGQRLFVSERGGRRRGADETERSHSEEDREPGAHATTFDA